MHDVPYVKRKDLSPEITSTMARICTEVRKVAPRDIACGVQVSDERGEIRDGAQSPSVSSLSSSIRIDFIFRSTRRKPQIHRTIDVKPYSLSISSYERVAYEFQN